MFFSRGFLPASCEVEEVIKGCLLKLKVQYENVKMLLINVYAPCNAAERLHVLSVLCETVFICGADSNCAENPHLDRNHQEPYRASSYRLQQLM